MSKGYAHIFVFCCGRCNRPVTAANIDDYQRSKESFSSAPFATVCHECGNKASFMAVDAQAFKSVEWNFEIKAIKT